MRGLRPAICDLNCNCAMDTAIAHVALLLVMVLSSIVKEKLPSSRLIPPPVAVELPKLFALAHQFFLVGKIGINLKLKFELNRLHRVICEVNVFVHAVSHRTREPQLYALLGYLIHLSAA